MEKKFCIIIWVVLALALAAFTVYMYLAADANFAAYFSLARFCALFLILDLAIAGFRKCYKELVVMTAAIFLCNYAFHQLVFGGALERFLYHTNRNLYQEAAKDISEKRMDRHVYLSGPMRKLSKNAAYANRKENHLEIYFYTPSSIGSRSRIVYTDNLSDFIETLNKRGTRLEIVDQNWCILFFLPESS